MALLPLGGRSAPEPNIQKMPDASSWHSQTIFAPNPNCFYHAYKTALISSHEKGHGPLLRPAYGAPSWARVKHICPQGAERMGSLEYVFTLLPVNSSLLQVMLACVCSTLPRSFLLDNTWAVLHFDLIGQFKDSQIGSGLWNQLE